MGSKGKGEGEGVPVMEGMVPGKRENKFLLNWTAKPLSGCCVWFEITMSYTVSPPRRTRWPLTSMPLPCWAVQMTGRLRAAEGAEGAGAPKPHEVVKQ